jgi:carbon monoxide dehydrogenase subunit G
MATVRKSIAIEAPREKVFDYIEDPLTSMEWSPGTEKVTKVTGEGVGQEIEWIYKMAGIKFNGKTIVREVDSPKSYVTESVVGILSNWVFTLDSYHDGDTKLNLDIEYTIPIPVLGKLAEKIVLGQNEKIADQVLNNIKTKMEE